jgi:hypothetical protein
MCCFTLLHSLVSLYTLLTLGTALHRYYTPVQYNPSLTRFAALLTTALLLHANELERHLLSCYNTCHSTQQYVLTGSAILLLKLVRQKLTLEFQIKPI